MIQKFGMEEANPVTTPADINVTLEANDCVSKPFDRTLYQSLVGSLLYAAVATRPDTANAVATVAKYSASPNETYLTAAKRVLRYLKGTKDIGLCYEQVEDDLVGYAYVNWAGDKGTRR